MAIHPLELVHLDYLCLEPGKGKEENILMVMDHFTHYAQAYVTQSQTTLMTAKTLWDNLKFSLWATEKVISDQGRNFKSEIADLCRLMGNKKLRTSWYHPQTNGQCERFNSILIGMFGTLPPECESDRKGSIGALVHTYNPIQNSATAFSLHQLHPEAREMC